MSGIPSADGQHVYYLGAGGHVQQLSYSSSSNKWTNMVIPAAPLADGSAISSFAAGNGEYVYYVAGGDVQELYTPNGGSPVVTDLTLPLGGPSALSATISSFAIEDGRHVYYLDGFDHVNQLYYSVAAGKWVNQDLSQHYGGDLALGSTAISSFAIEDGQHVYYVASNQHVEQFWYVAAMGTWINQDLSLLASGPPASPGSGISSFATDDGEHIYYVSSDQQHVEQLFYSVASKNWVNQDLTMAWGGELAASGANVSGFAIPDGQHVYYIDRNDHLEQLFYSSGANTWFPQDLTQDANGPLAWPGQGMSAIATSDGQHVYYIMDANPPTTVCGLDGESCCPPATGLLCYGTATEYDECVAGTCRELLAWAKQCGLDYALAQSAGGATPVTCFLSPVCDGAVGDFWNNHCDANSCDWSTLITDGSSNLPLEWMGGDSCGNKTGQAVQ
jgi:hypothetical protein